MCVFVCVCVCVFVCVCVCVRERERERERERVNISRREVSRQQTCQHLALGYGVDRDEEEEV